MEIEYNNFIGFYRNVYPAGYCEHLINEFERATAVGVGYSRQQGLHSTDKHEKDDYQISEVIDFRNHALNPFKWTDPEDPTTVYEENSEEGFFNGLQRCYNAYSEEYSVIRHCGRIRATTMKMQRTSPGQGYHVWHAEQGPPPNSGRILVYALYLNALDCEGGETEFLYQKMRIKPEENLMLFWPASYTHAHRGNPVLGNTNKYIVTGWFYID